MHDLNQKKCRNQREKQSRKLGQGRIRIKSQKNCYKACKRKITRKITSYYSKDVGYNCLYSYLVVQNKTKLTKIIL